MANVEGSSTGNRAQVQRLEVMMIDANDDDEEINLENMPSLSSYVAGWKFWWTFSLFPAGCILANVVAVVSLLSFDKYKFEGSRSDQTIAMFKANSIVAAFVLLVDTLVFYKTAIYMEREMKELNEEEDNEGNTPTTTNPNTTTGGESQASDSYRHVRAKVSHKFDKFLGKKQRPKVSIFVAVLYVATVLTCAGSLTSFGVRTYAGTSFAKDKCSVASRRANHNGNDDEYVKGIPDALQEWAQRIGNRGYNRQHRDYIHTAGGTTFFAGRDADNSTEGGNDDDFNRGVPVQTVLISTSKDGSMTKHSSVESPEFTPLTGGVMAADTFCCAYKAPDTQKTKYSDTQKRSIHYYHPRSPGRVFCLSPSDDSTKEFHNVSLAGEIVRDEKTWMFEFRATKELNGVFWCALVWDHRKPRRSRYDGSSHERIMEYYNVTPLSMQRTSVVNVTADEYPGRRIVDELGSGGSCMRWFSGITGALVALMTFPSSYWLIKSKHIAAGVVPATLAAFYIISAFNGELAYGICLLFILASTVCFFGRSTKWLDRETLLWGHYALLFFISLQAITDVYPGVLFLLLLGLLSGVILNHPVRQVAGWVLGPFMVFMGIFMSAYEGPEALLMIPFGVILACGTVNAGRSLKKYRTYISFYMKRMWNALDSAFTTNTQHRQTCNTADSTEGNGESDLTRRLID